MDTNDTNQPETQPEPSQARCAVPICSAVVRTLSVTASNIHSIGANSASKLFSPYEVWHANVLTAIDHAESIESALVQIFELSQFEWDMMPEPGRKKFYELVRSLVEPLVLPNTNVQRRSGDQPASPSALKPTDQPQTPERSL